MYSIIIKVCDYMKICLLKENNPSLSYLFSEVFHIECPIIDIQECQRKNIRFLCAFDIDKIVGAIMITLKEDPVKGVKSYYLDYVSVLDEYQNQGIGTMLMREMEQLAFKESIDYIQFTSNRKRKKARMLYTSLGYLQRDTNVFYKKV